MNSRPCGIPGCVVCNPDPRLFHDPYRPPADESLAADLLALAGIVLLFIVALVLLPVMA